MKVSRYHIVKNLKSRQGSRSLYQVTPEEIRSLSNFC